MAFDLSSTLSLIRLFKQVCLNKLVRFVITFITVVDDDDIINVDVVLYSFSSLTIVCFLLQSSLEENN